MRRFIGKICMAQFIGQPDCNDVKEFDPRDIPGLVWWLDPDISDSLHVTGGYCSAIDDLSGLGGQAVQSTESYRPAVGQLIDGLNTLYFDGVNDFMTLPSRLHGLSNGPSTFITVFKQSTGGNTNQRLIYGKDAGTGQYYVAQQAATASALNRATTGTTASVTVSRDEASHIMTFTRDGTKQHLRRGGGAGVSNENATSFTMTELHIGAQTGNTNRFNGWIRGQAIYDRAITLEELNLLGAYYSSRLNTAWAVAT